MELLKVDDLTEAVQKMQEKMQDKMQETECVSLEEALGRIVAEDIVSGEMVPSFRRSTVDGYAVVAKDTFGVTENIPTFLTIIGEVEMGREACMNVSSGTCVYVPTGGMIPDGADAMVMVEYTELFSCEEVAIYKSSSVGNAIIGIGDDLSDTQVVVTKGTKIRSAEIGSLSSLGIMNVLVYKQLCVTIISTGDEVIDPSIKPKLGQIRDVNSYALEALCTELGMHVLSKSVVKDVENDIKTALTEGESKSDIVLISGGSSKGKKDMTSTLIDEISMGGVFTHGLALKPGKPTIIGYSDSTRTGFVGLPGHPVAAMQVLRLLMGGLMQMCYDLHATTIVYANMETNFATEGGKDTCLLVELIVSDTGYVARPILGRSGLISTLSRAYGYIMIPKNKEGVLVGERVCVTPI